MPISGIVPFSIVCIVFFSSDKASPVLFTHSFPLTKAFQLCLAIAGFIFEVVVSYSR